MSIENVGRPFEVHAERRGGAVVLEFLGELDLWGHDEAAATLAEAVTDGARVIVVNLQGLSFMDSTGSAASSRPSCSPMRPGHGWPS